MRMGVRLGGGGVDWAALGSFWPLSLVPFSAARAPSWCRLGLSWGRCLPGPCWGRRQGRPGLSWARRAWAVLGPSSGVLYYAYASLGAFLALFWAFGALGDRLPTSAGVKHLAKMEETCF